MALNNWLSASVAAITFISTPQAARSANYEATGQLVWFRYSQGQIAKTAKRNFKVVAEDTKWFIRTEALEGPAKGKYDESYFDGTNLFTLTKFPISQSGTNLVPAVFKAGTNITTVYSPARAAANDSIGSVEPVVMPRFGPSLIAPVWLAFCSGAYLADAKGGRVAPVWDLPINSVNNSSYPITAKWELLDSQRGTPARVVYHNKGLLWQLSGTAATDRSSGDELMEVTELQAVFYPAPPPFDKGFTNAVYQVLTSTNIVYSPKGIAESSLLTLPTAFQLTYMAPPYEGSGTDMITMWAIAAQVESITVGANPPRFAPEANLKTLVVDERIERKEPGQPPIRYLATHGIWAGEKGLASLGERKHQVRLVIIRVLLVSLVILPPLALLVRKWRKNKTNE